MTTDHCDLQALLDKWQPRLGLMHWNILIRWANGHETNGDLGEVRHNSRILRADILVLDREDPVLADGTYFKPTTSVERTVVHELIHLVLAPMTDQLPDSCDVDMERAVIMMERALVPNG